MKPLIIIPDANQKNITMSVEEFKKIISEVWEEEYKEGQIMETTKSKPFSYITPTYSPYVEDCKQGPSSVCGICSGDTIGDNFINKRTFDKESSISKDTKINVW